MAGPVRGEKRDLIGCSRCGVGVVGQAGVRQARAYIQGARRARSFIVPVWG